MRVLVWQWGRRGAGPRVAAELARAFAKSPGTETLLSLSAAAELLRSSAAPACTLEVPTYRGILGFVGRVLLAPVMLPGLVRWLRQQQVDVALCAMPAPLDLLMATALRRAGVPYGVVVHDADLHPGDQFPLQMRLQRWLLARAGLVFALSTHVKERLEQQGVVRDRPLLLASLPPFAFGPPPPPSRSHGGAWRVLSFGRLLPYKGLDLLAESLERLGPRPDLEVRVVGSGPETPTLDRLRRIPGVVVENRWVPEDEVGTLLGWADALVLSHREASQSGVAAAAAAARRWLVATRVGGLEEQVRAEAMTLLCEPEAGSLSAAIRRLLDGDVPTVPPAPDPAAAWQGVADAMVRGLRAIARQRA